MDGSPRSERRGRPVYAPAKGAQYVGASINTQGNLLALTRREPGRQFQAEPGVERPAGRSTARMASGVNPLDSVTGPYLSRS